MNIKFFWAVHIRDVLNALTDINLLLGLIEDKKNHCFDTIDCGKNILEIKAMIFF